MLGLGNNLININYIGIPFTDNYSVALDGTGDYLNTGATFQSTFRDSFSVSLWAKVTDGQTSNHQVFFGSNNSDSTDAIGLYCRSTTGNLYFFLEGNNDYGIIESDSAVFANGTNDWKHLVVTLTHSGSSNATPVLYVDGSAIATTIDVQIDEDNQDDFTTTDNLYIGGRNNNGTASQLVTGSINDFAIWNVALDADAVAAIYNSGTPIDLTNNSGNYDNSTNLVGYWKMEEGTGTTVADSSGNGNAASFAGDPQWDSSTP